MAVNLTLILPIGMLMLEKSRSPKAPPGAKDQVLYCYGLYRYGLHTYGLYTYGLFSYDPADRHAHARKGPNPNGASGDKKLGPRTSV